MDLIEVEKVPTVVSLPSPMTSAHKEVSVAAFLPGETLGAYSERVGLRVAKGPVHVWHNGHVVPPALWTRLIPRNGDSIVIRARMQGGGGGSKILRTVAMVALVVAAITIPGAGISGLYSGFGLTGTALSLASAGIMIGGSLLINALLPPPQPTAAKLGTGQKYESSPTYSIQGGRNRMRQWEPMTVIFGRHKIVPDLGAQYYTEYVGDDQYLNQLFHFGLQADSVVLSDFKIGDTPIENYQGVEIEVSGEDGALSMFPGNVDTLQGFVVNNSDGWIQRTTSIDTNYISVELAAQLFRINDNGSMSSRSVELEIDYRPAGGDDWQPLAMLTDAIYATHYWALMQEDVYPTGGDAGGYRSVRHQIGYGSTNFSDHTPGGRVTIRPESCSSGSSDGGWTLCSPGTYAYWTWTPHPHARGRPWRGTAPDPLIGYSTRPGVRLTGSRQEPTRKTVSLDVAKGQYEIRVRKTTGDVKNSRESNETAVGQILCFQPDEADYTGQLRVALRIKATNQLNGAVDEFNAIAHASAPVWNGDEFDIVPTSNPAAWFFHFARGKRLVDGTRVYGGGLDANQIDVESLNAWAAWCDAKKLTFNYVLDRKMSTAEVLQMIARAGRASPTWQSGKLGVIWDAADLPHVAMFGPFNIKAGTFKVDYINEGTVDEIIVNFTNEKTWSMDEVRAKAPGATTTNNPLQLDFDGCTNVDMAGREANLLAASQVWHRRRISWETDIEGWVANRGDVVQFSHDLKAWGYSGRLMGRDGNIVTLDKIVPTGGSGTMMLRGPEGQMRVVAVISDLGEVDMMTITTPLDGSDDNAPFPLPGDDGYDDIAPMDWAWFFDPLATPGRRFKITHVEPSGTDSVKFQAVDDDSGYYASEHEPYIHVPPRDGQYLAGVVFGITMIESIINVLADINDVQISWALSMSMPVDVVISVNDVARPAVRLTDRRTSIQAQTGDVVHVVVTPASPSGRGNPSSSEHVVLGLTSPLPALTGLTSIFRDGLTMLTWDRVIDIRDPDYEVRIGATWADGRTVAVVPITETLSFGNGLYWVAARYVHKGATVYGPPDSIRVAGAALVRNVLITYAEAPAWDGALSGGAYVLDDVLTLIGAGDILGAPDILTVDDILWYGGAIQDGVFTSGQSIDVGFVAAVRLDFDIDAYALNFGEDVLSMPDILTHPDILNESNAQYWRTRPQYRVADNDSIFGEWIDYRPGLVNARHFEFRLLLETDDPLIVPFVERFTWTIDVPDLLQSGEGLLVPTGGMRIMYEKAFHIIPNVQITLLDAIDGDRVALTNSDKTGFDVALINAATPKSGVINWIAQGY